ncbi:MULTISPECIES: phage tail assembly protein [unclassified Pseudomonas]|uniref:phage tail assembly protein n=1 Tax=unclassified Pseudomonas TaxID=196821 RepID=UPI0020969BC2|nr:MULTISPECIES: phage tail assembly protein [unclassified Pseudomonas]MCO7519444.1 phage tail assembly protein [Pseudomonas sp. 1]MCO7541850.1 phage tail assembly protein [Pseudomonas sp. VA159-2]
MTTVTHTLQTPIQAHGEAVTELELRRPTVQECRAIKALPYIVGESGYPIMEVEAVAKYIAVCAGIPSSSVNQLELSDLNALGWLIVNFFMDRGSNQSAN